MGEWERRWRGPPHDKSLDELPKATVRFLDSLRVMVADTYPGGPGDVVAIGPATTLRKTTTATTGRGRCSRRETCATTCARRSGGRRRI